MSLIDLLLNLVALLLWLSWRSAGFNPAALPVGPGLLSTLRKTRPSRITRLYLLLGLLFLLMVRAVLYWHMGPAVNWMPQLKLGVVDLTFRSDFFSRMALFSLLSFGQILAVIYLWLFLLSALNQYQPESDSLQKMIRLHLGWCDRWPACLKLLAPVLLGAGFWTAFNPLFTRLGMLPAPNSWSHLAQQAIVVGLGAFLTWKILIVLLLFFYLLNAYVFLGNFALWNFINHTARSLLRPLEWLPLSSSILNLTPIIAIALVILLSEFAARSLSQIFQKLPLA